MTIKENALVCCHAMGIGLIRLNRWAEYAMKILSRKIKYVLCCY